MSLKNSKLSPSKVSQIASLSKKNFTLKTRHLSSFLCELLLPVVIMSILVAIRFSIDRENMPVNYYSDLEVDFPRSSQAYVLGVLMDFYNQCIVFTPNQPFVHEIGDSFIETYPFLEHRVLYYEDDDALTSLIMSSEYGISGVNSTGMTVKAAISFLNTPNQANEWAYAIRMNATDNDVPYTTFPATDPLKKGLNAKPFTYVSNGFLFFQDFVEEYIISNFGNSTAYSRPEISIRPFPTDAYISDDFATYVGDYLGIFLTVVFLWPLAKVVKSIVGEKESRMTEHMKIMGVEEFSLFFSWFFSYFVVFAIQSLLITLVCMTSVFKFSNDFLIFLLFFLFGLCVYAFGAFVASLFTRSRIASTFAAVLFYLSFFVSFAIDTNSNSATELAFACLIPSVCISIASPALFDLESAGVGLQFSNMTHGFGNFTLQLYFIMMIVDLVFYLLLAYYLGQVLPSTFGVHRKWNYCCLPSFWSCFSSSENPQYEVPLLDVVQQYEELENQPPPEYIENSLRRYSRSESENAPVAGVSIRKMRKEFRQETGSKLVAVRDLCIDLYEDQVVALLGHNGAGKSTLLGLLTGLNQATSGDAFVYGASICDDIKRVRSHMGVCAQVNILYDELTVSEHVRLFARLKGVQKDEIDELVENLIQMVGLDDKKQYYSENLSGGQKRKLSLAIALIGGPKVIVLDEPTSGMDPYSRRATWELIKQARKGRVVILTTHFMDEADKLGDRIVIMSNGSIKCAGTPLFLKNLYGVGYSLTISKDAQSWSNKSENNLIDFMDSIDLRAEVSTNIAKEISFSIPFDSAVSFPKLFPFLDDSQKNGVETYGISVTTLEEVFLRVTDMKAAEPLEIKESDENDSSVEAIEIDALRNMEFIGKARIVDQLVELIKKRFYNAKRDSKVILWQTVYPAIILILGIVAIRFGIPRTFSSYPLTASKQYDTPNPILYSSVEKTPFDLSLVPYPNKIKVAPAAVTTLDEFAHFLLNTSALPKNSRYGSYSLLSDRYVLFYNSSALHSIPTYLNIMNNARFRAVGGSLITVSSEILPLTASQLYQFSSSISFIISIAFAFIPASFGAYIVNERSKKVKHLQLLSGVNIYAYWLSNFVWDFLCFLFPCLLLVVIVVIFDIDSLIGENLPAMLIVVFLYGLSITPFTYICSFLFSDKTTAQSTLLLVYIISGITLLIAYIVMSIIESTKRANDVLVYFYRFLPNFAFAEGITNLMIRSATSLNPTVLSAYSMDVIGTPSVYMACEAVMYFILVLLIEFALENHIFGWFPKFSHDVRVVEHVFTDEDVLAEEQRVAGEIEDSIVIRNLRKVYKAKSGTKVAVENLSLGVGEGECFGYLGPNGAGKTSTLKILTLDLRQTSGSVLLKGYDILENSERIRYFIGYCPQFEALMENLTAREQIRLYAVIKGMKTSDLNVFVDELINQVGLQVNADDKCSGYSGGNRRKLAVALALIGNPPIVFLDEPSTGIDPKSRRSMWNLISTTMKGRSVILTTHSMDEAEALCDRIGIMVNGRLCCLGNAQHLKSKYGSGYQFDVNVSVERDEFDSAIERLKEFVENTFSDSEVLEVHNANVKFSISNVNVSLAEVFATIEANRKELSIAEYSVSQTDLEQIFLRFSRNQIEGQH